MKRLRSKGGFTLIELLIVIIIIGILAAIAIPMFLNQRDKAKGAAVREGVHSVQIGVQTVATDSPTDIYPTADDANFAAAGSVYAVVDNWPQDPWAGGDMANDGTKGNFTYVQTDSGASFYIDGFGSNGEGHDNAIITVGKYVEVVAPVAP